MQMPLFTCFFIWVAAISSSDAVVAGPHTTSHLPVLTFDEGYTRVFGGSNLVLHRDGKTVHISLDETTGGPCRDWVLFTFALLFSVVVSKFIVVGAGFASQDLYLHGFFSASIKLPADYAAGVVVAFYMSNGDMFEKTHDELDFEFLGNIRGKEWRIQTNVYGNGSTSTGREERYGMWFGPTVDFHHYSILWSKDQIIEIRRNQAIGNGFPSKPMSLYATIWDGSGWATSGGRYRINYKYGPYVAEFADLILHGCSVDPTDHSSMCDGSNSELDFANFTLSSEQVLAMLKFRKAHMTYTYCYDRQRYQIPPAECEVDQPVRNVYGVKFDKFGFRRPHLMGRRAKVFSATGSVVPSFLTNFILVLCTFKHLI